MKISKNAVVGMLFTALLSFDSYSQLRPPTRNQNNGRPQNTNQNVPISDVSNTVYNKFSREAGGTNENSVFPLNDRNSFFFDRKINLTEFRLMLVKKVVSN